MINLKRLAVPAALLLAAACAGTKPDSKPAADAAAAGQDAAGQAAGAAKAGAAAGAAAAAGKEGSVADKAKAGAAAGAEAAKKAIVEPPGTPDAEFRAQKPAPSDSQAQFQAPVPVEKKLKNGARLLVAENHQVPLVAIDVVLQTGVDGDPAGKAGLSEFVAAMLDEGTKNRSATKLAEDTEDLAAILNASAGRESSRVHLNSLKETLPEAVELLADVLQNPAFKAEDLERVRGLILTDLVQKKASPAAIAADESSRILFGEKHPWGQPAGGTPESVKAITADDLRKFHDAWYRPNNAIISVSGDVTLAEVQKLLDGRLAAWKSKPLPKLKLPALPVLGVRSVVLVDKPGASQSQVRLIGRSLSAKDPDAVALRVANNILGGLFGSRLNMNLRENKGYTYGAFSAAIPMKNTGTFSAQGDIKAQVTAEALQEFEKELTDFAGGTLREGELDKAKEAYTRSLPALLETNDRVAASLGSSAFLGLPLDYYKTLPGKIAKVTADDVGRVARKYIKPEQFPVVIVGPKAMSEEKLRALNLGAIEVRALPPGAPAQPASPETKPAADKPADKDKPTDKAADKPADKPAAPPADKTAATKG